MCFSASASFTASGLLIPTGIYCLREAMATERAYLPLSSWPLFFGIQQTFEGFLWLGIENNEFNLIQTASLGFLFFSHFFWLFWTPFSAFSLETNKKLRIFLMIFTLASFFFGALLYFPLFIDKSLLNIEVANGSIYYLTRFMFGDLVPKHFTVVVYAIIILVPLLISSNRKVNFLGSLIFFSAIATYIFFSHAFISVWCFFAAILSLYLLYAIRQLARLSSEPIDSLL